MLSRVPNTNFGGVVAYNERVVALARDMRTRRSRITVAWADRGFSAGPDTWDPAHPNARGELKIAAAMADGLSRLGIGPRYPRPLPHVPLGPRIEPVLDAAPGDGQVRLAWHRSPGATGHYIWLRDVTAGQPWSSLPDPVPGASWVVDGLTNLHTYELMLQPVKGHWPAEPDVRSNVVSVTPAPGLP